MTKLLSTITSGFLNQPKALPYLFSVELWERFGFYIVQSILILYLTNFFHLKDSNAFALFTSLGAFLYATPFLGGFFADKVLGQRKAIVLGAILLGIGYFLMMIPKLDMLYWSLGFLIAGNGFLKSCISAIVGSLYSHDDPRRDAGFTIFYMGINVGSFLGPFFAGFTMEHFGWSFTYGFGGVGMVVSLFFALAAFKRLNNEGMPPKTYTVRILGQYISGPTLVYIGTLLAVIFFGILITHYKLTNILFNLLCAGCVIGTLCLAFKCNGQERTNMLVLIVLISFAIVFWAVYTQMFSSINLFTDRVIDRSIFGYTIPTAFFQTVNPLCILLLTPFFVRFWPYAAKKKSMLATGSGKFALALFLIAAGFGLLVIGIKLHAPNGSVAMTWLNLSYLVQTAGELALSPIGLSLVTELAPANYRSMMMGGWFLSIAAGYSLGDHLAKISSIPESMVKTQSTLSMLHYYQHEFLITMLLALVSSIILWLLVPFLNRCLKQAQFKTTTDIQNTGLIL